MNLKNNIVEQDIVNSTPFQTILEYVMSPAIVRSQDFVQYSGGEKYHC